MSVYHSTTPLPPTTLSTTEFRWLVESDWENSAVQAVAALQDNSSNLLRFSPTISHAPKKALGFFSFGQWVLNPMREPDQCYAWATAQIHLTKFRTVLMAIQPMARATRPAFFTDAIGVLISAVLIGASADELIVTSADDAPITDLVPSHWGDAKTLYVPTLDAETTAMDKLTAQSTLEIVPPLWWRLPESQTWAKTLHYLRVRQERSRDKTNPLTPCR